MGRPEQERSERIRQMQFVKDEIIRIEPAGWNDPLVRRKLLLRLAREWGLRIETVLEYEQYLK